MKILSLLFGVLSVFTTFDALASSLVQFGPASYRVAEGAGKVRATITRTGATDTPAVVRMFTEDALAVAGDDYSAVDTNITLAAGVRRTMVEVPILNDSLAEPSEVFTVRLSVVSGEIDLGANAVATVEIRDDDKTGLVGFTVAKVTVPENRAGAYLMLSRKAVLTNDSHFVVTTRNGSAQAGEDYKAVTTNIVFTGANTMSKALVYVPFLNDGRVESNETFQVEISRVDGTDRLDRTTNVTITIKDDDNAGVIQFGASKYSVNEGVLLAAVPVFRTGGMAEDVAVDVGMVFGAAVLSNDFIPIETNLTFAANQSSNVVLVPIVDDLLLESSEAFSLVLTNPMGGATLGPKRRAVVSIEDNDTVIGFSAATYTVTEGRVPANIVIERGGVLRGTHSVVLSFGAEAFRLAGVREILLADDGTATAGDDYIATNRTLVFRPNVKALEAFVSVLTDSKVEDDESVELLLSHPTGGTTLLRDHARLVIKDALDLDAVSTAGDGFMEVTVQGIEGNNFSRTLSVHPGPRSNGDLLKALYVRAEQAFVLLDGGKLNIQFGSDRSVRTILHDLNFPWLKISAPGTVPIEPSGELVRAIYHLGDYTSPQGGSTLTNELARYITQTNGAVGHVRIDALDVTQETVTGRFDFIAVEDIETLKRPGPAKKVRITGRFRLKDFN